MAPSTVLFIMLLLSSTSITTSKPRRAPRRPRAPPKPTPPPPTARPSPPPPTARPSPPPPTTQPNPPPPTARPSPPPPAEFYLDHYVLALTWPYTFCSKEPPCIQANINMEFSVHGLWPSLTIDTGLVQKSPHRFPQTTTVGNWYFTPVLRLYWPGLKMQTYTLWRHEWGRHGVYSGLTPEEYFEKAYKICTNLKLSRLLRNLRNEGIQPGNNYRKEDIRSAFKVVTGHDVTLNCYTTNNIMYLLEVRLCTEPAKTSSTQIDCAHPFRGCGHYKGQYINFTDRLF